MTKILFVLGCGLAGCGLAAIGCCLALGPEKYVSTAVIRYAPSNIPEQFLPNAARQQALEKLTGDVAISVASRTRLADLIQKHDLYRSQRARLPLEDLVAVMDKDIQLLNSKHNEAKSLEVSFGYSDPVLAQKVAMALATRIMQDVEREREGNAGRTVSFLNDQVEQAARNWEETRRANQEQDRQNLDIELARKNYIALKESLADARAALKVIQWRQGPSLELLDPANLPIAPANPWLLFLLGGATGGALIAVLALWWRGTRKPAALERPVFG